MISATAITEEVRNYYGKILQSSRDLKTGACCSAESLPVRHREILGDLHPEVCERFYGCGSPLPPALEGCAVLDLGCGAGRDVYLASRLVGPEGRVIGVDMTAEQLAVARRHVDYHTRKFGYGRPNVDFREGYIEDLAALDIADDSVDVVISNCVINLSPQKRRVFSEIFRVLKPGGELYFSDVFADRRVPAELVADPLLRGECLGGAMYSQDFRRLLQSVGVVDYRTISVRDFPLRDPEIEARAGMIGFCSATIRAFKLAHLEDRCEDYGQVAWYLGTIEDHPHSFALDDHHDFQTGRPMLVCGNTAAMVSETRYGGHFRVAGDRKAHFGLFDCSPQTASGAAPSVTALGGCC